MAVRILIVDDDEISRGLLREAIEEEGTEVAVASDGLEGLEKLAEHSFDILITDLNMPGMDGLSLLREARQRYPEILSIIVTGYGSLETAINAIRQGAYDYIQKPLRLRELTITTRNAIEKIRILRDRNRILEELAHAYRKLHQLEAERQGGLRTTAEGLNPDSSYDKNRYYVLPSQSLPLAIFDRSAEGPSQVLTDLERLRDLKLKGVVDSEEFDRLKATILERTKGL